MPGSCDGNAFVDQGDEAYVPRVLLFTDTWLLERRRMLHQRPAFLFDLDGTLVDSVYQHVLAWREALEAEKIELSVRRIHRTIGMSGGLR